MLEPAAAHSLEVSLKPTDGWRHRRTVLLLLLLILAIAAGLRLVALATVPPGLNQDEAANAWNAWCLLQTGRDQSGARWPAYYVHALGENRTVAYVYATLPFQLLAGMNVWTTRLPAALGGVLTVLLFYWLAARVGGALRGTGSDCSAGLLAAALLAVNPWHIQQCRFGLESSLAPLLVCGVLAAHAWAGLPPFSRGDGAPATTPKLHYGRALLAGLLWGAACYGYAAVRIFLPLFLMGLVLTNVWTWSRSIRMRRGALAVGLWAVGFAATFGPLLYQHIVHPEQIARRAGENWLWDAADGAGTRLAKVAGRYVTHFGPDFLFLNGDHYAPLWASGFGVLSWYVLPLLVMGLIALAARLRGTPLARLAWLWVLLYPVGDILNRHVTYESGGGGTTMSLHGLRSAPGIPGLLLAAGIGGAVLIRWFAQRKRSWAWATAAGMGLAVLALEARFLAFYFGPFRRQPEVYHGFHADLVAACRWLRPRVAGADAVFITATNMNMPYIVTLVEVGYDPRQWFRDEREFRTFDEFEYGFRFGKFHFIYDRSAQAALAALRENGRPDRVLLIVRPSETGLRNPAEVVYGPDGRAELLLFDETF